jgi:hypothetical protein
MLPFMLRTRRIVQSSIGATPQARQPRGANEVGGQIVHQSFHVGLY